MVQHACNPCLAKPCTNNGVCINQGHSAYKCQCPKGYEGPKCQKKIVSCSPTINCGPNTDYCYQDEDLFQHCKCLAGFIGDRCDTKDKCYENPCKNDGHCSNVHGDFVCTCKAGFTGSLCQIKLKPCYGYCKNGGSCQYDYNGQRICNCLADYTGSICEHGIEDYCALTKQPCHNGGICSNNPSHNNYTCSCPYGFTGPRCQLIDERCIGNNCTNGATCTSADLRSSYICLCPYGFTGKYCEICVKCHNGGQCVKNSTGHHVCNCPNGYTGHECQYIRQVSFISTNSYVKMPGNSIDDVLTLASTINLSLRFSTYTTNGLLAYDGGSSDFMSIEIVEGKIEIRCTLWGYPTIIQAVQIVNDGVQHYLSISIARKQLKAIIDNTYMYTSELFPKRAETNFESGFYIGGIPVGLKYLAGFQNQIASSHGFVGCVNEVIVNNATLYFHLNRKVIPQHRDIMIGCVVMNIPSTSSYNPCANNPCSQQSYCLKMGDSDNATYTCLKGTV